MVDLAEKTEQLRRIVQNAHSDPIANAMIRRLVVGILAFLGVSPKDIDSFIAVWLEPAIDFGDITEQERSMREALEKRGAFSHLGEAMRLRAEAWYRQLGEYVEPGTLLDLGGGSGELAWMMYNHINCIQPNSGTVTIADALDWRKEKINGIPFLSVKENKIAADDKSFDTVMAVTVFHHSDDPASLVQEAFRVAKKRVVFIESVTEDLLMYQYGSWIDWFYNRVIHFNPDPAKKINVPCHFMPSTGWEQLVWHLTGLKPTQPQTQNLGIFQFLNPENHYRFVYDKK